MPNRTTPSSGCPDMSAANAASVCISDLPVSESNETARVRALRRGSAWQTPCTSRSDRCPVPNQDALGKFMLYADVTMTNGSVVRLQLYLDA